MAVCLKPPMDQGNIPEITFSQLKEHIKECNKHGIVFNYVFNASTLSNREFNSKDKKKILSFFEKLYSLGVRRFTITLPSVISLIKNSFDDIEIVLSTINNITSEYQLKEFLNSGKVVRAYVAEEMNRRQNELKKIAENSDVPVSTIVNPFCLFQCAYRYHHYNFLSFRNKNDKSEIAEYYQARCEQIKANNLEEIIKIPMIRPVDIDKYLDMGINHFKIAGREMIKMKANLIATAEAYMSKSYKGDLINLINNFSKRHYKKIFSLESSDLDPFYNYILNRVQDCSRNLCDACGTCKKYSKYVKINKKEAKKLPKFRLLK